MADSPTLADSPLLAERTTLRVGGPAESWVIAETDEQVIEAVRECDDIGQPALLLGEGSNLVVADAGFPGTVVEVATRGVGVDEGAGRVALTVMAGEPWDALVGHAVAQGWSGIEALSGIPGRAGATPIQNVGAYGQEVAQVISTVHALDRVTGELVTLGAADCGFGYRTSLFKREVERWAVLSIVLHLTASRQSVVRYGELARLLGIEVGGDADIDDIRAAVLVLRRGKGMVLDDADHDTWSAGSFFVNPVIADDSAGPDECPRFPAPDGVKLSAAWLIEHAGVGRGFALDDCPAAAMSSKHALAVTNRGGATAADIMALAGEVRRRVRDTFAIDLAIEPTLVGLSG